MVLLPSSHRWEDFEQRRAIGTALLEMRVCAVNSTYILIIFIPTAISLKYKEPAVKVVWTMGAEHVNDMTNSSNRLPDVLWRRILSWEQIQQALSASTPGWGVGSSVILPSCRYACQKTLPADDLVIKIISVDGGVIWKLFLFSFFSCVGKKLVNVDTDLLWVMVELCDSLVLCCPL